MTGYHEPVQWTPVNDKEPGHGPRGPDDDRICYVTNERHGSKVWLARYIYDKRVFVQYDPSCCDPIPIDVTHYVALPDPFRTYVCGKREPIITNDEWVNNLYRKKE